MKKPQKHMASQPLLYIVQPEFKSAEFNMQESYNIKENNTAKQPQINQNSKKEKAKMKVENILEEISESLASRKKKVKSVFKPLNKAGSTSYERIANVQTAAKPEESKIPFQEMQALPQANAENTEDSEVSSESPESEIEKTDSQESESDTMESQESESKSAEIKQVIME